VCAEEATMPGWGVIPSIRASDTARLVEFYERTLGFTVVRNSEDSGNTSLSMGDARLMIEPVDATSYSAAYNTAIRSRAGGSAPHSLYIEADGLAVMYDRAQAAGAVIVDAIAKRPWGQTEFTVEDPEGNWLTFWEVT
jgi:uncharacterized glyoxalase superfamily protein PhnB